MSPERLGNISSRSAPGPGDEVRRQGVSAAPGIIVGTAFLKDSVRLVVPDTRIDNPEREVENFKRGMEDTRVEIESIRADMTERMGEDHARIFDAHLLILDDLTIVDGTTEVIRREQLNAAAAFEVTIDHILKSFGEIEDEYLKDRYVDVLDVKRRAIRNLLGESDAVMMRPTQPVVIVAHDLSPSDTSQLDRANTLAYATDLGGRTSHTAIIARSQGVPAVVGLDDLFDQVHSGDTIIVDGNTGTVIVKPTPATLEEYELEQKRFHELEEQLLTLTGYPAVTLDDKRFGLGANLDMPDEVESALEHGAQGVGLFRTEYYFISNESLPSEDEQYHVYRSVAEKMGGRSVTIRTLDIGGDKIAQYLHSSAELNPFMGWRGIRFCLTRKDIFKTQLRAIYRASAFGKVRIMFPMISQFEEVMKAKEICAEVMDELRGQQVEFDQTVELGIMIETPSAVAMADQLGKVVDFFSIGTNDLIQYTMAVDRGNAKIAHLYQNLHPAIIRSIKQTVDAARKREIHVSVCGEMCGDPLSMLVLIGLQIDEFSASPNVIPEIKRMIRSVTFDECRSLVKRVMRYRTAGEIETAIEKFLETKVPVNGRRVTR